MEIKYEKPINMWKVMKDGKVLALFTNKGDARDFAIQKDAIMNAWTWLTMIEETD